MKDVYVTSDNIVCPIGLTASEVYSSVKEGLTGLKRTNLNFLSEQTYTSVFNPEQWEIINEATSKYPVSGRFEQLLLKPIIDVINDSGINTSDKGFLLVISTTKGNINELGTLPDEEISLHHSANNISKAIGCVNKPVVISNGCISGLSAIITAMRLLKSGLYHTAIVAGADMLGKFIISGFDSLKALSPELARPFDKNRQGINLGEGSGAILIKSSEGKISNGIKLLGGSVTNDANHVSAPSRTGEEMALAIQRALTESNLTPEDIQFVSAHGTGTIYNDEMEAKALNLANIGHLPIHSLKGYFGHTLGAAGIIESIICFHSLKNNTFIPGKGFKDAGTTMSVNICTTKIEMPMNAALKTLAGFGGCNAALVFSNTN